VSDTTEASRAEEAGPARVLNANLVRHELLASKEAETAIWNALTDEEKKLASILFKKHGLNRPNRH
jgi:hypothetical protein